MSAASASANWPAAAKSSSCNTPATAGRSIASRMTPLAMTRSPDQAALLPRTMTSLCISSIPAELLARGDHRPRSRQITASSSAAGSTSPSATATPSAAAPRDNPIEA